MQLLSVSYILEVTVGSLAFSDLCSDIITNSPIFLPHPVITICLIMFNWLLNILFYSYGNLNESDGERIDDIGS